MEKYTTAGSHRTHSKTELWHSMPVVRMNPESFEVGVKPNCESPPVMMWDRWIQVMFQMIEMVKGNDSRATLETVESSSAELSRP